MIREYRKSPRGATVRSLGQVFRPCLTMARLECRNNDKQLDRLENLPYLVPTRKGSPTGCSRNSVGPWQHSQSFL